MVLGTVAASAAGAILSNRDEPSGGGGGGDTVVIAPQSADMPSSIMVNTGGGNARTPLREKLILIVVVAALLGVGLYVGWLVYNAALDQLENTLQVLNGILTGGVLGALNPFNRKARQYGKKGAKYLLRESWDGATRSVKNTPAGIISRLLGGRR